ncbi:MAG: methyltransferase domain-containing protein [Meiothermus sp.]|nr:methyltransferase domain-containing protein [Meiothermus sp.]
MEGKNPKQKKLAQTTFAARSNLVPLTALGYELWRKNALTLLSGRNFPLSEEYQLLLNSVQPVHGLQFLDLGTSTGLYSRALLLAGAEKVYALDFSPAMLRVARRKVDRGELPVGWGGSGKGAGTIATRSGEHSSPSPGDGSLTPEIVQKIYKGFEPLLARAEDIPLPDESVDGVVVGGSWNEFPDPEQVVQEMYRVLRPGGRVFLMLSLHSGGPLQRVLAWSGLRFPTLEAVQGQLEDAGLRTRGWRDGLVGFVTGTKVK